MTLVDRTALKYYGGKWRLAPWIISHFPEHTHYIEPCFGAGSVLLRKDRVELETVNDLNNRIVNFFEVLRDDPERLIHHIGLTPWATVEYERSKHLSENSLEDARRFFIMSWMSVSGAPSATGFRSAKKNTTARSLPSSVMTKHSLDKIASRIAGVQIFNLDAIDFLNKFSGDNNQLIYFDPPYPRKTRASKGYGEFDNFDNLHAESAEILRSAKGFVVVSGYRCDEYKDLYEKNGWLRMDKELRNNRGVKTESLWLSPRVVDAIGESRDG